MRDFLYPLRVLHGRFYEYRKEKKKLSLIRAKIRNAGPDTVLFVMTPEHGNLGDHAIAVAVSNMLKELNIAYLEITVDELKLMMKHKKIQLMNPHPILVNGGGNIGTLWQSVEELFRSIILNCPDSRILCLPNTAFFEDSEHGQNEFAKSKQIYQGHKALTICAREKISYELLKQMHDRVYLIPDMVLSLNECRGKTNRNGCLLCLRSDRERTRGKDVDSVIAEQAALLFGSKIFNSDMYIGKSVPIAFRESELSVKFDTFRSAALVITDRLHGMIFAAITGTPCIVIDSKSPKVRGCYEWIKELGYICFLEDINELSKTYQRLPQIECQYTSNHLQPYYQNLKQLLLELQAQ